jgi:sulfite reductase beta subunit-like hemoprotein
LFAHYSSLCRALSVGLTGCDLYHGLIRRKVAEFLTKRIDEKWCKLLMPDKEERLKHVNDVAVEARDASDVNSYARDLDFAAASKLFQVNVLSIQVQGGESMRPIWKIAGRSQSRMKEYRQFPSVSPAVISKLF